MISCREKTASASESLANNLAANAADGEETVHGSTMSQPGGWRQEPACARFETDLIIKPRRPGALVNHY
jgi:hypothetical protein